MALATMMQCKSVQRFACRLTHSLQSYSYTFCPQIKDQLGVFIATFGTHYIKTMSTGAQCEYLT